MATVKYFPYVLQIKLRKIQQQQIHFFKIFEMTIRLRKISTGWISEYKQKGFFKDKLKPLITYSGLNEPFPFISKQSAINDIIEKIKKDFYQQL